MEPAFLWPVPGHTAISSGFDAPRSYGPHNAIDVPAPRGTAILPLEAGTVILVFILRRKDPCLDTHGGIGLYAKRGPPGPPLTNTHHLRITYTLDGCTFQVVLR